MSAAREQRAASEERVEGARARDEELKHAIASELECEPAGLAALAGHTADKPLPGGAEVERKLENLRQERERLGAVNLRADDELVEVLASRDRLDRRARRSDRGDQAPAAARSARSTRKARERLVAAFDVVNGHFKELFATLFEGGSAELQLVESDDPLEAGPRTDRPAAGQEAADADAAFGRRAGADRDGADLRGVPHQSRADLRARRGRRAARRLQCRALLRHCSKPCASAPTRASSPSPTIRSPWRAWTACSASPWPSKGVSQIVSVELARGAGIRRGGVRGLLRALTRRSWRTYWSAFYRTKKAASLSP